MSRITKAAGGVFGIGVIALIVGLPLGLIPLTFHSKFIDKCNHFKGGSDKDTCVEIWNTFQRAHVYKDPCNVPMSAYDPLFALVPFKAESDRMIFWSKTGEFAHRFTKKCDFYITLEDTRLGHILNDLARWCGKEDRNGTFNNILHPHQCPNQDPKDCPKTPENSFWDRASDGFARVASGDVTVMLNGDEETPFNQTSTFGRIEAPLLDPGKITKLKIILVSEKKPVSTCSDPSLKVLKENVLQAELRSKYTCEEISKADVNGCIKDNCNKPCW